LPKKYLKRIFLFDVSDEVFEAVEFEFVYELELLSEGAFGEAFVAVPNDVILGEVDKVIAFVFAKGHFGVGELD
jgi:hypothetical protein